MEDMFSRFIVSEDDIARRQVEEDLQLYGSRPRPPDAVDNDESIQLGNRVPKRNASVFEATVDRPAKLSKKEHSITFDDGAVTAMDWNSGASPLDAWLNQSAIPSTATVLELPDQPGSVDDLVAQEVQEIKFFRNVHLLKASNPEEKETAVDEFEGLELAAQIYCRNIRDWYPLLPTYFARRLGQANYQRFERFRSEQLKSEQPNRQFAVQPHSVSSPLSHTGGPVSTMIQTASDLPAVKPVERNLPYPTVVLEGQVNEGLQNASKIAEKDRQRRQRQQGRQRRKKEELERRRLELQTREHRLHLLRKMRDTSKIEGYLRISPMRPSIPAPLFVDEFLNSSPHFHPSGSQGSTEDVSGIDVFSARPAGEAGNYKCGSPDFQGRLRKGGRQEVEYFKSSKQQIHELEEDMKDCEWYRYFTATVGAVHSIIKSTTQVVDELIALEFAEAGNAPTSPAPSYEIRSVSAYPSFTQSTQLASDNQIHDKGRRRNSGLQFPESPSSDFWTGMTPRESPVSSINSSLHGRPAFDPQEQNPTFLTDHRRGSRARLNMSKTLPPPPVELGKVLRFNCDICGRSIQVARRLEWQ